LGRVGSPLDVAEAVAFLWSSDYLTGVNLRVDGGRAT
jgi:NAD(P)-dependent dehydrogenase (short-subunit alcohol dehydrogenase family)